MIEKDEVTRFVKRYRKKFEEINPSFFEWTVGLAFDYFSRRSVEIAVIETGLGGRLDSTNIVTPLVSVITNVQWDHMNLLGNTLQKIAREKAGIIKKRVPVVIGATQKESAPIFRKIAHILHAPLVFADQLFHIHPSDEESTPSKQYVDVVKNKNPYLADLVLDLGGNYQTKNLPAVLATTEILQEKGFELNRKNIRKALGAVKKIRALPGDGRFLVSIRSLLPTRHTTLTGLVR